MSGRPRVLDDVKRREICALMTAGYDLSGAAQYVGCSTWTIRREIELNEEFAERFRKASLAAELEPLNFIRHNARSNWRAAAWYLERHNPQRYAKRNPVLVNPQEMVELMKTLSHIVFNQVRSKRVRNRILRRLMEISGEFDEAMIEHIEKRGGSKPARFRSKSSSPQTRLPRQ
jgi:hypothetical protein